jgi:hypothetical protein
LMIQARNNQEIRRLLRSGVEVSFISSFFRSGNTWTRCLLADILLQNKGVETTTSDSCHRGKMVPDIHDDLVVSRAAGPHEPLAVKSHETYDMVGHFASHHLGGRIKVLYLFRSPEDALVSYYHFRLLGDEAVGHPADIERFCRNEFPAWKAHVTTYLEAQAQGASIFFMSYERLLKDTEGAFTSMLKWLGVEHDEQRVRRAVANMKFEKLRLLEEERAKDANGKFFFRRGIQGAGAAELPSEVLDEIRQEGKPLVERLETAAEESQKQLASRGQVSSCGNACAY